MSARGLVVAAYVSGHGYGHFTRSEAVLARLASGGAAVHARTSGVALSLARRAPWLASVTEVDVGPGLVQRSAFEPDLAATLAVASAHADALPALAAREADALRALAADVVYADVPPLAFAAAALARVPSVACANFSWSAVYSACAAREPALARIAAACAAEEAKASLLLALPFPLGLESFPRREAVPLVVRPAELDRARARALLPGKDDGRPRVLLSFGGFGASVDLAAAAARNPRYRFVAFLASGAALPENVDALPHDHGLPHQSLVLAADAAIAKLGYGTVAELVQSGTPVVHVDKGLPGEYPILAEGIARHVPARALALDDLLAGRWSEALDDVLARPRPPRPPIDGARVVAERVVAVAARAS